jgi:nucleoside-diphosphate-sugar epimerase
LLSAGPMQLAQKFLATGEQFQSEVVFSSSSVETKRASDNPAEREQIRDMLALESELQLSAKTRGSKLVIFRPTLIYGCGLDTNISQLAKWIRRFGFMPVNGRATGLRQPVHADDLASVAVTALLSEVVCPDVMTLTGGETLSYSDMVSRIFSALEKPVRLLHLPQWLFVLLVNLASRLKAGGGINGEMVKRQKLDLVFDKRVAQEIFSYDPRPFEPAAEDFSLPGITET